MLGMFNHITYSYLVFDNLDYAPEPQTADTACRKSSSLSLKVLLKTRPFVKWNNVEFTHFSSFA
jgi:hypothetical protein